MHRIGHPVRAVMRLTPTSRVYGCLLALWVCSVFSFIPKGLCAQVTPHRSVVVVVANWLSLEDLLDAGDSVRALLADSAIGLMNTGRYRQNAGETRFLVLGAGRHVSATGGAAQCYSTAEPVGEYTAGQVYLMRTGRQPPEGGLVCPGIARLVSANSSQKGSFAWLGDAFHDALLSTAFIGSVAPPAAQLRWAGTIAMDSGGIVDSATVDSRLLRPDPNSPYGFMDDVDVIADLITAHLHDSSLIVVQLADLPRCENSRAGIAETAYQLYRSKALRSLDSLVERVRPKIESTNSVLIICSPSRVRPASGYNSNLTPIVCFGRDFGRGLLTSATTLTRGLIANVDFAPTVLDAALLPVPDSAEGSLAQVVQTQRGLEVLRRMEHVAARNYATRGPVLGAIAVIAILTATLAEVSLLRATIHASVRRMLRSAVIFILSLPAALLLVDGLGFSSFWGYIPVLLIASLAWIAAARIVSSLPWVAVRSMLGMLLTMTAMLIAVDVLTGQHLLKWSLVTCNQIVGIRYYGLGNEYMGILVGAGLLGPLLILDEWKGSLSTVNWTDTRWRAVLVAFSIWFVLLAFTIGYPAFGSNVGGLVTAVSGFGTALVLLMCDRFRWFHTVLILLVSVSLLGLFAIVDAHRSASSHLGRSLSLAEISGMQYLIALITRKLAMHIGILALPQASLPVLCSIPFFLLYRARIWRENSPASRSSVFLRGAGMPAVLVAAFVGFVVNDSGVVPAGLLISLLMLTVLELRLKETSL